MIRWYKMGRIGFILMLVLSLAIGSRAAWAKDSAPGAPVELSILSVNDFHGALVEEGKNPGIAKLGKFIKDEKDKNPTGTIILSAGDMFQGSADSNLLYGKTVTEAMNEIEFDAIVVGNHEFDWGNDKLMNQIKRSNFPYLGANVIDKRTEKIANFIKPHIIITKNGISVGIIGIATPETSYKSAPKVVGKYKFMEPAQTVNKWVKRLRGQGVEVIVVLSHLGCEVNQETGEIVGEAAELAKSVKGVDLLITGHSHQRVMGKVNGIPIIQAGYYGRAVGICHLVYSPTDRAVVSSMINIAELPIPGMVADVALQQIVGRAQAEIAPIKNEVLGKNSSELTHNRNELSVLGQWSTDIMRSTAGADIAFQNGGGLRTSIPAGTITVGKMYEVIPFDNTLYVVKLTGKQVIEILRYGINNSQIGMVQFSGITVRYNGSLPEEQRVISVQTLDGKQLDPEKVYKVVTNDFMAAGGDGFITFKAGGNGYDTNIPLRDALTDAVKKERVIRFMRDNRFSDEQPSIYIKAA